MCASLRCERPKHVCLLLAIYSLIQPFSYSEAKNSFFVAGVLVCFGLFVPFVQCVNSHLAVNELSKI